MLSNQEKQGQIVNRSGILEKNKLLLLMNKKNIYNFFIQVMMIKGKD